MIWYLENKPSEENKYETFLFIVYSKAKMGYSKVERKKGSYIPMIFILSKLNILLYYQSLTQNEIFHQ
jgi:hypothetical protein